MKKALTFLLCVCLVAVTFALWPRDHSPKLIRSETAAVDQSYRWGNVTEPLHLIDVTPDGSLQPILKEEAYYWDQTPDGIIKFDPDVAWHPNEKEFADGKNIRVGYGNPGITAQAVTNWYIYSDNTLASAWIVILPEAFGQYSDEYLRHIVGHEMGHAIGLAHITSNVALMNPIINFTYYGQPQAPDYAALRLLYGA